MFQEMFPLKVILKYTISELKGFGNAHVEKLTF